MACNDMETNGPRLRRVYPRAALISVPNGGNNHWILVLIAVSGVGTRTQPYLKLLRALGGTGKIYKNDTFLSGPRIASRIATQFSHAEALIEWRRTMTASGARPQTPEPRYR